MLGEWEGCEISEKGDVVWAENIAPGRKISVRGTGVTVWDVITDFSVVHICLYE